jgi:hypothetical protein
VKGTLSHDLHFSSHSSLGLLIYFDADWARDTTNRHSTNGCSFLLGDFIISWCNKKQSVVARSNTKAECRTLVLYTCSHHL